MLNDLKFIERELRAYHAKWSKVGYEARDAIALSLRLSDFARAAIARAEKVS